MNQTPFWLVAAFLLSSVACLGQCAPAWTPGLFTEGGISGTVEAFVVYDDDGSGPHRPTLVAGGTFTAAGGISANNIAAWDGTSWSPLGSGVNGTVRALAIYDDDGSGPNPPALIAGGSFTMAGGAGASLIARWDGASWSSLGLGLTSVLFGAGVSDLVVFDQDAGGPLPPFLFVGGDLITAGGIPAFGLARWNGSAWSVVGQPGSGGLPQGSVVAELATLDPDGAGPNPPQLVAAGGIGSGARVASWNGVSWSFLGGTFNASPTALEAFDPDGSGPLPEILIAAGPFVTVDLIALNGVAAWSGTAWMPLGSGLHGQIPPPLGSGTGSAIAFVDEDGAGPAPPALIVGGEFIDAGGVPALNIARWNGAAWSALGAGLSDPTGAAAPSVRALAVFDDDGLGLRAPRLFVGGRFTFADAIGAPSVAVWNGFGWSKLGSSLDGGVKVLLEYDADGPGGAAPALCAAGTFSILTPLGIAQNVALWNGFYWAPLGNGVAGSIYAATLFDVDGLPSTPPSLVVGGDFGVVHWNGASWAAVGSLGILVRSLCAFDDDGGGPQQPALFAGGSSPPPPPPSTYMPCPEIRRLMPGGGVWTTVGLGLGGCASTSFNPPSVLALAVFDEDASGPANPFLFAGGTFSSAAGSPAFGLAKWNGSFWQSVGSAFQACRALAVHDPDGSGPVNPQLVAGGLFTMAGSISVQNIARWTGTTWLDVSGGVSATSAVTGVYALGRFDPDGGGPLSAALIAGGVFTQAGGAPANNIAVWDGTTWFPLGSGLSGSIPPGSIFVTPAVTAIAQFDDDANGPLPTGLYAGGSFTDAGGFSSGGIAKWSVPSSLVLGFAISGQGALTITNMSCIPGGRCFTAFSLDPLNATAPGLGVFAGLHIPVADLVAQFLTGAPPFVETLDSAGGQQFVVPASFIAPLSGSTLYGLSMLYKAAPLLPYLYTATDVTSIVL